jgi:hypothetical protein
MSDQVYQPDHKPLLSDSALTYFAVLGFVAIGVLVFLGASYASTASAEETTGIDPKLAAQRIAKREEVNGAGRQLISTYGKSTSTSGAFRIPADEAAKLLVTNPAALDAARGVK